MRGSSGLLETDAGNGAIHDDEVVLVFPPAMHPTSPPLGIAALKAFLQMTHPSVQVRAVDLNLEFHRQAASWVQERRLRMRISGMDADLAAVKIAEVNRFLQGEEGFASFLELDRYNVAASFYEKYASVLHGLFDHFCRRTLCDLTVPPLAERFLRELIQPVLRFSPRIAGFSILFSQQLIFALAMAKILKEHGVAVVLGGATLSVMPHPEGLLERDFPLQVGGEWHRVDSRRILDLMVLGEGEVGISRLLGQLGGELARVPGLVYRQNGRVVSSPPLMIPDLDALPLPDFSDFDLSGYLSPLPVLPYLSSRGCFWGRCAFCTHRKTYLAYREESEEQTAARLKELSVRHGVIHFNFVDEMIHPRRLARLSGALLRQDAGVFWSAYAKPTGSFDPPLMERLHRSGLRLVMWGVESGSQRVLDAMGKGVRAERAGRILTFALHAGVWNLVFLLFGFPTETEAEWEETLRFLEKYREAVHAVSKSRFVLLAGSKVMKDPEKYGITRVLERPERDLVSIAYDYRVRSGLTQEEVRRRFQEQLPRLERVGKSPHFGIFRDHLLLHASAFRIPEGGFPRR